MMSSLLFLSLLALVLALIGRARMPARERIPLRAWTARDLVANVRLGVLALLEVGRIHARHQELLRRDAR